MTAYIDAPAAAKLLIEEDESQPLIRYLDDQNPQEQLASSALLETELRRVAVRLDLPQTDVSEVLTRNDLVEPDRSLFDEAGILPGESLRSLDALHLVTAVLIEAQVVVAYDVPLLEAARNLGLTVSSPV